MTGGKKPNDGTMLRGLRVGTGLDLHPGRMDGGVWCLGGSVVHDDRLVCIDST